MKAIGTEYTWLELPAVTVYFTVHRDSQFIETECFFEATYP